MDLHQRVFKLASIVLQHPESEWQETEELKLEIAKVDHQLIRMLFNQFMQYLNSNSIMTLCENYARTFDFSESTTLYLTHRIFAENPDRGKGLVRLKQEFVQAGFPLESDELPDFLPLVLEFCSFAPIEAVQKILLIHRKSFDLLLKELSIIDSPYQLIVQACLHMMETIFRKREAS